MIEYISTNGANILAVLVALMAAAKVVVRLTPSVKDDAIFGKVDKIFEFLIPNYGSEKKE
jgi:hypothetical protein|tara:strand:- start:13222 stop:13401 length:180 start_codon:yes stop_codon:yes gene_type:complete